MKKILSFCLLVSFTMWGMGAALLPVNAQVTLDAGSVIKMDGESTLYYLGEDDKVYVFPNAGTYFSWFDEFTGIVTVSAEDFALYELGGTVYYQPGSLLVKTPTSLKVYAIGINGELRWIETEELAIEYYGINWNLLVDDMSDGFFTNYTFGESIDEVDDYNPDLEAEEVPTISHNKGFKAKAVVASKTQKRCEYLENAVNKLQKRAERWGMEIPSLGDDYIEACIGGAAQDAELDESEDEEMDEDEELEESDVDGEEDEGNSDKITVCKTPRGNSGNAHTIRISKNALKANINAGFLLGSCEGDDEGTEEEESDEEGDDEDPALEISEVESTVTTDTATITWVTNLVADSSVEYDLVTPFVSSVTEDDSTETMNHEIVLSGLTADTMYYFVVSSEDASSSDVSIEYSFTTEEEADVDETAPVITAVLFDEVSSTVTWTTDEDADSKVVYATETIVDGTETEDAEESDYLSSHVIELSDLATSTEYFFYVESSDEAGNLATSSEYTFITLE